MKFSEFLLCFHNSCEIWHFFSRAPMRNSLWCCYRWLIKSSLLLRCFDLQMAKASAKREWLVMNRKGTMGRVQTAGEATSRPLSPSRLPFRAHFHRKRDVWVRGRIKSIALKKCKKECDVVSIILAQGFCPLQIEIIQFPVPSWILFEKWCSNRCIDIPLIL